MSDFKQTYTLQAKYEGKGELGQFNRDLAALGKLDAFSKLEAQISKTETALEEAEKKAAALKSAMEKGATGKAAADYARAENEVKKLSAALEKQNTKLEQHAGGLKKYGVDLRNLSAEEKRLATTVEQTGKVLSARQLLGVKSTKEIKAEVGNLRAAYETLRKSGTSTSKDIANAQVALKKRIAEVKGETGSLEGTFRKLGGTIIGVLAVRQLASYGAELLKMADQYTGIDARLKMVSESSGDFLYIQKELYRISQETGTEYTSNADSYAKLAMSFKDLGADSKETLSVTELVNKSLIINGSNSEMASSFMLQFAQAMGSGVLQGDEFRAMLESNSYFAKLLAKALGINIAGLRQMSKDGKLTADVLRTAFPKMAEEIDKAFAEMPKKVDMAMNEVRNAFGRVVNETNQASGGTSKVAEAVSELAKTIERNGPTIRDFFADTANLASSSLDFVSRFLNTFSAFRDLSRGTITAGDYFSLDADQQRAYGSIRTELQMIRGLQADIGNARRTLALHERFSIFYDDSSLAAEKAEISEMESYVEILRARIVEKTKKFGDGFKEVGESGKKAFEQVGDSADKSANKQTKVTGAALDAMKEKYKNYAEEVKRLQDDIADREQSLAEQLREMDRSGMSDSGAWKDRKDQAEEYADAARKAAEESKKAFEEGNEVAGKSKAEEAVGLYDKARGAAADLNREVKDGDTVIATQQQNLITSRGLVEEYGTAALKVQQNLQEAMAQGANALDLESGGQLSKDLPDIASQFGELTEQAGNLAEKAAEFDEAWNNAWDRATLGGQEAIATLEKDLKELTKDRHIKVYVEEIESKSSGGLIGLRMAMGGPVGPFLKMAAGGNVFGNMLAGGFFPGFGGGDRRHVIAEDGEYMFDKHRVKDAGLNTVRAFHAGRYDVVIAELMKRMRMNTMQTLFNRIPTMQAAGPQYMQNGGEVTGGGSSTYNLTVNFSGSNSLPVQQTGRQLAETVLKELKQMHRYSSS